MCNFVVCWKTLKNSSPLGICFAECPRLTFPGYLDLLFWNDSGFQNPCSNVHQTIILFLSFVINFKVISILLKNTPTLEKIFWRDSILPKTFFRKNSIPHKDQKFSHAAPKRTSQEWSAAVMSQHASFLNTKHQDCYLSLCRLWRIFQFGECSNTS